MEVIKMGKLENNPNIKMIETRRNEFFENTTIGEVYTDGEYFSLSLEDAVRPFGVKVNKRTAIPELVYRVIVTDSTRFGRPMIQLYNAKDDDGQLICTDGKIKFTGVRNHGGNTHHDTEGCPITAYNRISETVIQGRSDEELFEKVQAWIDQGFEVYWKFRNIV